MFNGSFSIDHFVIPSRCLYNYYNKWFYVTCSSFTEVTLHRQPISDNFKTQKNEDGIVDYRDRQIIHMLTTMIYASIIVYPPGSHA